MSSGMSKGLWLGLAAVVILGGLLLWFFLSAQPFVLVILFDDVGDLKRGDPVLWRDFAIGRVDKIEPLVDNQIGVTIRLREDYANRVGRGSVFTLKRSSVLGLVGHNAVEIVTPASPGPPFASGEKVEGTSSTLPSVVGEGIRATLQFWSDLKREAGALLKEFNESEFKQDATDALEGLGDLAEKGVEQAREGIREFHKEHQAEIDRVIRKLEELRDKMRRAGDEAGARKVESQIETLRK